MEDNNLPAWAGAVLDDWRRRASAALGQAQRSAQRLQRDAGRHTERWLGGLRQRHAHGAGSSRTRGPALGSITLAAGRPDRRQSLPGRGARLRRGLNVVADLAAEPGGGGGGGAPAPNAEPAGRGDAQPEEERILISEARAGRLTVNELVGPCLKQEQAVRCRMRPMQARPRKARPRRAGKQSLPATTEQGALLQVEVRGVEGELRRVAEAALSIKPNFGYTLKEVQDDVHRVFDSGFFEKCHPHAEDTRDGVKLTVEARPRGARRPQSRGALAEQQATVEGCSTSLTRARCQAAPVLLGPAPWPALQLRAICRTRRHLSHGVWWESGLRAGHPSPQRSRLAASGARAARGARRPASASVLAAPRAARPGSKCCKSHEICAPAAAFTRRARAAGDRQPGAARRGGVGRERTAAARHPGRLSVAARPHAQLQRVQRRAQAPQPLVRGPRAVRPGARAPSLVPPAPLLPPVRTPLHGGCCLQPGTAQALLHA